MILQLRLITRKLSSIFSLLNRDRKKQFILFSLRESVCWSDLNFFNKFSAITCRTLYIDPAFKKCNKFLLKIHFLLDDLKMFLGVCRYGTHVCQRSNLRVLVEEFKLLVLKYRDEKYELRNKRMQRNSWMKSRKLFCRNITLLNRMKNQIIKNTS